MTSMDPKKIGMRISIPASLSAFANWLVVHPVAGDRTYSANGVRYQAARYCEYLHSNPWLGADPLGDEAARDGAVWAYQSTSPHLMSNRQASVAFSSVSTDFTFFSASGPSGSRRHRRWKQGLWSMARSVHRRRRYVDERVRIRLLALLIG